MYGALGALSAGASCVDDLPMHANAAADVILTAVHWTQCVQVCTSMHPAHPASFASSAVSYILSKSAAAGSIPQATLLTGPSMWVGMYSDSRFQ